MRHSSSRGHAVDEGGEIVIEDAALAGGFVQVPTAVMFDTRLTPGAKVTYGALLWYAWKDGHFPGQRAMAQLLGGGESTIRRHLSDLEKAGYIVAEQLGLGRPNRYIIKSLGRRESDRSKSSGPAVHKRAVQASKSGRSVSSAVDSKESRTKPVDPSANRKTSRLAFAQAALAKGRAPEEIVAELVQRMKTPEAEAAQIVAQAMGEKA